MSYDPDVEMLAERLESLIYTSKRLWEQSTGLQYAEDGRGGVTHPSIEAAIETLGNVRGTNEH